MGRSLRINFSGEKPGGSSGDDTSTTLFVGNISFNTTRESLERHFSKCGPIKAVRVAFNEDGRVKGFAHVEFESSISAQKAL